MSSLFEFMKHHEMYAHEEKLKNGYVVIPHTIRKYFNYNQYIHKDEVKELYNSGNTRGWLLN